MKKIILLFIISVIVLSSCTRNKLVQTSKTIEAGEKTDMLSLVNYEDETVKSVSIEENNINYKLTGSYDVVYKVETKSGEMDTETLSYKVIDTIKPEFKNKDRINVELGNTFEPLNVVKVVDNSDSNLKIEVLENNVDSSKLGEYIVKYRAEDMSNNITDFVLNVEVAEPWEDYELQAIVAVNGLKDVLKNPDSLQVHSIEVKKYYEGEVNSHFKIDCSAQNGFGGMNRENYYIELKENKVNELILVDDLLQSMAGNNFEKNSNVLYVKLDVDKIINNLNRK